MNTNVLDLNLYIKYIKLNNDEYKCTGPELVYEIH